VEHLTHHRGLGFWDYAKAWAIFNGLVIVDPEDSGMTGMVINARSEGNPWLVYRSSTDKDSAEIFQVPYQRVVEWVLSKSSKHNYWQLMGMAGAHKQEDCYALIPMMECDTSSRYRHYALNSLVDPYSTNTLTAEKLFRHIAEN